jgi:Flp pilus assembly protein TadB
MIKRRINKFNSNFPDAIELMVRGLRSGLPITETLGIVAGEIGPGRDRVPRVSDKMKIGRTMEAALQETADRLGTPNSSSSSSRWRSSARPAATSPKRCRTSPTCCASAPR